MKQMDESFHDRLPVTVVVPAKNAAHHLGACLGRLADFAQVLVVDSGSSDGTEEVARQHRAEVLQFVWDGRFPKKRNWVLRNYSFATEWVFFLDADEWVSPELVAELRRVLPGTSHSGFWLDYERHFMGKSLRGGDPLPKLALFRVGAGEYERVDENSWSGLDMEVHEHPVLTGTVGKIRTPVIHRDYRGMQHYIAKHNDYSTWEARRYLALIADRGAWERLTPRQRTKYRHLAKWWFAPAFFLGGYVVKRGFLDGAAGFHFALAKAIYFYQIRLKILELQQSQSDSTE